MSSSTVSNSSSEQTNEPIGYFNDTTAIKHYVNDNIYSMYIQCMMIRKAIFQKHNIPFVIPTCQVNELSQKPSYLVNQPGKGVNPLINPDDVEYDNLKLYYGEELPTNYKNEEEDENEKETLYHNETDYD